jgi:hypothetical protein
MTGAIITTFCCRISGPESGGYVEFEYYVPEYIVKAKEVAISAL